MKKLLPLLAGLVLLASCGGGGGGGVPAFAPGSGALTPSGGGLRFAGRVAFVDGAGNPVAAPAGGALVLFGSGTDGGGTDANGRFDFDDIPAGAQPRVRIYSNGFLKTDFFMSPHSSSTTTQLICRIDPNPGDNPPFASDQFIVPDSGVMHYELFTPDLDSEALVLQGGTTPPNVFGGFRGETVPINSQVIGDQLRFTADLGQQLQTGSLQVLLSNDFGVTVRTYGTCQLNLTDYRRTGRLVNGIITGPNGQICVGAECLAFEQGNSDNRSVSTSQADGKFGSTLEETPTGQVSVQVQWTDPETNVTYVCWFKDNN